MRAALASLLLATAPLSAQPHQVGWSDLTLHNTSGNGSANVFVRVFYPATATGQDAPLVSRTGGWPMVTFLPGHSANGRAYPAIAQALVEDGYVFFASDVPRTRNEDLAADGIGIFHGARALGMDGSSRFFGQFDTAHAAICGHSLGGGAALELCANNPGYVACVSWAGTFPGPAVSGITVPFCLLHGEGDGHIQWFQSSLPTFQFAVNYTRSKALCVLNNDCDENNIVGFLRINDPEDPVVWATSQTVSKGFLRAYLQDDTTGFEHCVGATGRSLPHMSQIQLEVEHPELWPLDAAAIGQTARYVTMAEQGPMALLIAATTADLPTPFGQLRLDPFTLTVLATAGVPANRLGTLPVTLPNDPGLQGLELLLQAAAVNRDATIRLTRLSRQVVL